MVIKIKVKNADKFVLLDHEVFEALNSLTVFQEYHVMDHIREHSSGVPVFQKYLNNTPEGKLKVETIYLAHFIAKKYIPHPESEKRMFLSFLNGDKLDLRLKNLKWESMKLVKRSPRGPNHPKLVSGEDARKLNLKSKRTRRKKHHPLNRTSQAVNTTPVEIEQVNLLPAHFEPLRKKRASKPDLNDEEPSAQNNFPQQETKQVEELIPQEHHI